MGGFKAQFIAIVIISGLPAPPPPAPRCEEEGRGPCAFSSAPVARAFFLFLCFRKAAGWLRGRMFVCRQWPRPLAIQSAIPNAAFLMFVCRRSSWLGYSFLRSAAASAAAATAAQRARSAAGTPVINKGRGLGAGGSEE